MRAQVEDSVERCQEMENVSVNMMVFDRGFENQQKASGVNDEEDEECSGHGSKGRNGRWLLDDSSKEFRGRSSREWLEESLCNHVVHNGTTTQRVAEKVSSRRIRTGFTWTTKLTTSKDHRADRRRPVVSIAKQEAGNRPFRRRRADVRLIV